MPQRTKDMLLGMSLSYLGGSWGALLWQGGRSDLAICAWLATFLVGVSLASAAVDGRD